MMTGLGLKTSGNKQRWLKELEAAIRSQVAAEERAHKIVERLVLDEEITEEFLISAGNFIMPSHYADVIEERSLSHRCGYPICNSKLSKIPSQKYTISTKTNRVYDITERKCFCSNFCYKASKYFESQLLTSPVWTRSCTSAQTFVLLRSNVPSSRHGAGDLLLGGQSDQLSEKPSSGEVEDLCSLNNDSGAYGNDISFEEDRNIVNQNSQSAKDQITFTHKDEKYLNKEKEDHVMYSKDCGMTVSSLSSSLLTPSSTSSSSPLFTSSSPVLASSSTSLSTSSSSSSALSLSSSSSMLSASSISKHQGKSGQPMTASACSQISKEEEVERGPSSQDTLIQSVQKVFYDWSTPVTREYLGLSQKKRPVNGCQGDKLETGHVHSTRDTFDPGSFMDKAARWFRPNLNELDSGNKSSVGSTQDEIVVKEKYLSKGSLCILPPIDSKSQNTIRRRIVLERLFQILPDLLSELKLTLGDVSRDLTGLVHTFSLSSQNVTLKPLQWKVAGLALILVLQRKNALISQALESTTGTFNALLQRLRVSQQELDSVVSEMILCEPLNPGSSNRGLPGDAASWKQESGDDKLKIIGSEPEEPEDFGDMEELD